MLRRLGYRAYSGAGHVLNVLPDGAPLPAWSHMVVLVQPFENSAETYLVDVGYGASGLCRPILFSNSSELSVQGSTKTERHRLIRKGHLQSFSPRPVWFLQFSHNPFDPEPVWRNMYAFPESEVLPQDYLNHNYSMCRLPSNRGTLRSNIVCVRHFFLDSNDVLESDLGKYVLFAKELKRSVGSQSELIGTFDQGEEKKRILALKKYFGIIIDEEGERWIKSSFAGL
jgi:arylamine N-acetyltransferase